MLFRIDNEIKFSKNHEVRVDYKGIYNHNYKFEIYMRNKSTDSVFVDPSSFKCSLILGKIEAGSKLTHCIIPADRIDQLEIEEDSLKNKNEAYLLSDKSVEEIVRERLISGTIGLLFGQNGEELELQRQEDEDDWEQEHNLQVNKVNEELYFWKKMYCYLLLFLRMKNFP